MTGAKLEALGLVLADAKPRKKNGRSRDAATTDGGIFRMSVDSFLGVFGQTSGNVKSPHTYQLRFLSSVSTSS